MVINFNITGMIISCFIFLVLLFLLKKRIKSRYTILFFALLYFYMIAVFKETQFPIFINNPAMKEELGALMWGRDINLIPFKGILNRTSALNIIMFIPLGFLLPFLINRNLKKIILLGGGFSLFIEITQLSVKLLGAFNFRVTDINDVICNTFGAILGYFIFSIFLCTLKKVVKNKEDKFLEFILQR
ncbi:MAG: VanZ family protein [Eubacterium sp.]|nr:VanZ family protein [Eubacterium sp.]MCI8716810.1 VanZ family protein [Lachnospiraceae bacterium]